MTLSDKQKNWINKTIQTAIKQSILVAETTNVNILNTVTCNSHNIEIVNEQISQKINDIDSVIESSTREIIKIIETN